MGKGRPDLISPWALTRLSHWYELGSKKYGCRNWEKGMPFSRYTASMYRHLLAWMKGDDSEDHLAAIAWNSFALMHHQELGEDEEWDDMPDYEKDSGRDVTCYVDACGKEYIMPHHDKSESPPLLPRV